MANNGIGINVTILESNDQIAQSILKALLPQVNDLLNSAFYKVKDNIITLVQNAIVNSPEYGSLLSGTLQLEFGIPDSASRLEQILSFWKFIDVEYSKAKISGQKISGSFAISMIRSDYSDVLMSSAATLNTEKGQQLNWLEWLLLFGDKTIIKEYNVQFGSNPRSRTGGAIMKVSSSGKWGVPPQFAGTASNNWITRAMDSVEDQINNLLIGALN
jgi:hypothetical protein